MRRHRFYLNSAPMNDRQIVVSDERLLGQWRRVLRYQPGNVLILFGDGQEHVCELLSIDKCSAVLREQRVTTSVIPKKKLTLAWSLLRRSNNELVVQKATELGVSELQPIEAQRSEKHGVGGSQMERWQKIAIEAAEQCGRGDVPVIHPPLTTLALVEQCHSKLVVAGQVNDGLVEYSSYEASRAIVAIGPEGGWSAEERQLFVEHHVPAIELGDFTLRAETAGIVAIALLQDYF